MRRSGVYIVNEPRENINVSSSNGHCKTKIIKMADVAPDTEADVDNAENIELTGTTDKKKVHAFYKYCSGNIYFSKMNRMNRLRKLIPHKAKKEKTEGSYDVSKAESEIDKESEIKLETGLTSQDGEKELVPKLGPNPDKEDSSKKEISQGNEKSPKLKNAQPESCPVLEVTPESGPIVKLPPENGVIVENGNPPESSAAEKKSNAPEVGHVVKIEKAPEKEQPPKNISPRASPSKNEIVPPVVASPKDEVISPADQVSNKADISPSVVAPKTVGISSSGSPPKQEKQQNSALFNDNIAPAKENTSPNTSSNPSARTRAAENFFSFLSPSQNSSSKHADKVKSTKTVDAGTSVDNGITSESGNLNKLENNPIQESCESREITDKGKSTDKIKKPEKPKKEKPLKKPKTKNISQNNTMLETEHIVETDNMDSTDIFEPEPQRRRNLGLPCDVRGCINAWSGILGGRSALTKLLCGLYALILISLGIVFSLADALTARERAHRFYLEGFLLYLYVVSFLFLLYFQIVLLRGVKSKPGHYDANVKVTVRRSTENINASLPNSPQIDPKKADTMEKGQEKAMDKMSVATDITNHLELPVDGGVAHVAEGINFYLRLGALAFSLGSVTLDGFQIASYFESDYTRDCKSIIFIPVYGTHLFFTFVQTFFLFKNHKVVIDRHKACVRFGMMHLVATNLCVWIMTVVTETSEEHRYRSHQQLAEAGLVPIGYNSCYEGITLARAASPYLFPCTIIYSIIASGILHKMYQYIGVKVRQKWPSHLSLTSSQPYGAASLDCEKANKGLFMGLLVAVLTAIAIATFFVFESRLNDFSTAIKLFYITQISLIVITAIGIMFGYGRLSKLKFVESYFLSLDAILLLIALCGCYVYYSFTLISIATKFPDYFLIILLAMVTIGIELIQITFQTVFVLDGLCRCADSDEQMITKPGRAVITFLLISNVALWAVSMFEMKKTMMLEIYEMFYGILPWNIITHICVPLIIFFRFHSAICLSKVWYQAYQKEKLI